MFASKLMDQLVIQDLHVSIEDQEIIRGLSLAVPKGEVHAVRGRSPECRACRQRCLRGARRYRAAIEAADSS